MSNDVLFAQRRLARLEKQAKDAELLRLHQFAATVMEDAQESQRIRARALQQVDKWEQGKLCSTSYIAAWRSILNMPLTALREVITRDDDQGIALRQNTPLGFLKERLQ